MCEFFWEMVRPEGLEPSTPGLEGPSSGYGKAVMKGAIQSPYTGRMPATFRGFSRSSDQAQ